MEKNNNYYNNKKLAVSCFWILLGATLLIFALIGKLSGDMWGGIGGGLVGVGILQIIRNLKYKNNTEYKQKIDIEARDERNNYIRMKAWSWTGYTLTIASGIISLILLIVGENEISKILGLCMCAEITIYWISYIIINKKY